MARQELANRLFFRLYQCANMMHKTGTRALDDHGVTTQQWAVLGALSRPEAADGMSIGELAGYLKVSRQNLSGVLERLEKLGFLQRRQDASDRRSRRVALSKEGARLWHEKVLPRIHDYYADVLDGLPTTELVHAYHYFDLLAGRFAELEGNE